MPLSEATARVRSPHCSPPRPRTTCRRGARRWRCQDDGHPDGLRGLVADHVRSGSEANKGVCGAGGAHRAPPQSANFKLDFTPW